jgi:dTDP-4-dehydrorhamnose reductase
MGTTAVEAMDAVVMKAAATAVDAPEAKATEAETLEAEGSAVMRVPG